jgi:hypothetical protein
MRTDSYRRVGGYRAEFYFAQDLDLWIRLARVGEVRITNEILYDARLNVGTISSLHRSEQVACASLAIAIRDAASEEERLRLLREAAAIRPTHRSVTRRVEVRALYFIAACLQKQKDPRWRQYVSRALRRQPLDVRSWLLLLRGVMT